MNLTNDDLILLYRNMVFGRKLDALMIEGLKVGKVISFYHSGLGSESLGAGVATFLRDNDNMAHHRGHGITYMVSKRASALGFVAEHYGKSAGSCNGISGFHYCEPDKGMLGAAGTIGSVFSMSLGWGLGCKKNGGDQVTVACFGDGGSNRGTLHEAFNLSSVWKLPIVWVCDNNGMAQFMPIKDAYAREDISDLAAGYDIPAVVINGMDVLAVHEAVQAAVARARAGEGPSMIEAKTVRYRSHSEGSPDVRHTEQRSPEEIENYKKRDPITTFAQKLLDQGVLTQAVIDEIDQQYEAEVAEIDRLAMESPPVDESILKTAVYAE